MTPNERHLTQRPPDGPRTPCPLPAMRNRLWPGGIRGAPRLRKGSQARRRPAKRQRPAPTVKRVAGGRRKHAGKTTPHRSETRHRPLPVSSRTPLTLDRAQSHRAVQPRLPRRSPAGPRHRHGAGPRYPQVAGPAAIATPPTHPRLPTAQGRGCLPLRSLRAAPRRCPTRRKKGRRAVARAGRSHRQPRSAGPEPAR